MADTLEGQGTRPESGGSRHICIGILAHVDAGKTTLSEAFLYLGGVLKKPGRVDHGDAFLDHFALERARGITIFSKQARLSWKGLAMTLLDTPGHADFGAETERALQALDYAILVINGSDGVQGHTLTLWKLLSRYGIPVFVFGNKMDQPGTDREKLLASLQEKLDPNCIAFGSEAEAAPGFWEELSLCGEELLEEYLEKGTLEDSRIAAAVRERKIFPCYFGSALRLEGVEELLDGLERFALTPEYPGEFGARVYKISRDEAGNRLTHLKVTGGVLRVKAVLSNAGSALSGDQIWEEKVDQIRMYEGASFTTADRAVPGEICAVTGLSKTRAGQGLGAEAGNLPPSLAPVMTCRLLLPAGTDVRTAFEKLRGLEEEMPELCLIWKESVREIHVRTMGEMQLEILKSLIRDRFGMEAEFGDGSIVYRETILSPVVGIGHFEPLRHYAEVHLLLEPGEPGSGLTFASVCSEDVLDRNWQRQVIANLEERSHPGVLTGSALTDMKITLLTGRAHGKHTQGGDFRQAAYRALRQGLMRARNQLLEPVYSFRLELPTEYLGRAMNDIRRMHGNFNPPLPQGECSVLEGSVPVSEFSSYQREFNAFTKGRGRLFCTLKGYEPCHNADAVIQETGYNPLEDMANPCSSVFCSHGAGVSVPWDQVEAWAHLESGWYPENDGSRNRGSSGEDTDGAGIRPKGAAGSPGAPDRAGDMITQEEIEQIFQSTYKKSIRDYEPFHYHRNSRETAPQGDQVPTQGKEAVSAGNGAERNGAERDGTEKAGAKRDGAEKNGAERDGAEKNGTGRAAHKEPEEYLLVDGYNIIFAWEELRQLAAVNIDSARTRLQEICCGYQGYVGGTLILVFDAYKVKGNPGSVSSYHNIYVVYTKEAQTADQYIEKTVHDLGKKHRVTVATSDALEQMIIWGEGASRLSAAGFLDAVRAADKRIREAISVRTPVSQPVLKKSPSLESAGDGPGPQGPG